ncbi:hypothetical protein LH51_04745 [Nitrincola sp. A-D6]|uniref:hypothetical protein n=1 Tax=Nitrincola sp. A-D6 TaxID=1545442 RepID=UPI00051FD763|nr:hypothetical protein [Nitrincola sp. A-D6]KGK42724.1 hypothetical protein LH51_04745 [Nitrincola sp. A-D6]
MKYQYVKGLIEEAIDESCIGTCGGRKRLLSTSDATSSLLDVHFPKELLADWKAIQAQMTKFGPRTNFEENIVEGAIVHTMDKIKNKTTNKIAKDIFKLHKNYSWITEL